MTRLRFTFCAAVLIAAIAGVGGHAPSAAEVLYGKVIRVHDGDTITLLDSSRLQHKIRIQGIDAPELGQAFGRVARTRMGELVFGKTVEVLVSGRDRYGRALGKVISNGHDAGLQMIADGLAWHYKRYQSEQSSEDRSQYADAEQRARELRLGLWRDPEPMAPWDYRRMERSRRSASSFHYRRRYHRHYRGALPFELTY